MIYHPPVVHSHASVSSKPTAKLVLEVPSNAQVKLAGKLMGKTGSNRSWHVPLPKKDTAYPYEISVQVGDQQLSYKASVDSRKSTNVKFAVREGKLVCLNQLAANRPKARLVVNVPDSAIVALHGKRMSSTGPQRRWNVPVAKADTDYRYRVDVRVGDQTLSRSVVVRAGKTTSITFSQSNGQLVSDQDADSRLVSL